jgi:excisionase family DNA binding protein
MNQPLMLLWQAILSEISKAVQEGVRNAMPATALAEEDLHPYTVQETATMLNCCRQTVHEYVRSGRLRVHKLGARSYFFKADIISALQSESYQRTPKASRHARR